MMESSHKIVLMRLFQPLVKQNKIIEGKILWLFNKHTLSSLSRISDITV